MNPWGKEDSPNPDAEETDVFLVMGADRRARKAKETEEKGTATPPRKDSAQNPPKSPDASPPSAVEPASAQEAEPVVAVTEEPPGVPDAPVIPSTVAGRPEHPEDPPETGEGLDLPRSPVAPEGIEAWTGAGGDVHTPLPGGYEQRIAAVRRIPVSPWRRAVFVATGGRLNLG